MPSWARTQTDARAVPFVAEAFAMTWSDSDTKVGHLSPFETCKAFAFHVALEAISTKLKVPAYELLGKRSQA